MSKRNINLHHIEDLKLRDDGKEVQLTFIGKSEQNLTVTMSFEQIQELEGKILQAAYSARLKTDGKGGHSTKLFSRPRGILSQRITTGIPSPNRTDQLGDR